MLTIKKAALIALPFIAGAMTYITIQLFHECGTGQSWALPIIKIIEWDSLGKFFTILATAAATAYASYYFNQRQMKIAAEAGETARKNKLADNLHAIQAELVAAKIMLTTNRDNRIRMESSLQRRGGNIRTHMTGLTGTYEIAPLYKAIKPDVLTHNLELTRAISDTYGFLDALMITTEQLNEMTMLYMSTENERNREEIYNQIEAIRESMHETTDQLADHEIPAAVNIIDKHIQDIRNQS